MPTISELSPAAVTGTFAADVSRLMTELAGAERLITQVELTTVAERNHTIVAVVDGAIIGLVCLVPMMLPQGVRLWIESVIVDPAYRAQGVGRRLMEAALERARSYGDVPISLTSNPTREVAHGLFERVGFSRANTSVFRRTAGAN